MVERGVARRTPRVRRNPRRFRRGTRRSGSSAGPRREPRRESGRAAGRRCGDCRAASSASAPRPRRAGVAGRRSGTPFALGHRLEHVARDRRRVEVEQPDPRQSVDGIQFPQQSCQGAALAPVDPVEGGVLGNQQQLASRRVAASARASRDDRFRRAAAIVPAQRRDDAERAGVVAALGDLHVGEVPGRRQQPRRLGVVEVVRRSALGARRRSGSAAREPDASKSAGRNNFSGIARACSAPPIADRRASSRGPLPPSAVRISGTSPVPSTRVDFRNFVPRARRDSALRGIR